MHKIILLGYMGSGKSTTGALLAQKAGYHHIDLDQFIEEKANLSTGEIFQKKGEVYFRKLEHDTFLELIGSEEKMVLSLGGGTPCFHNNHGLLKAKGVISFYLKASVSELARRLAREKTNRPLVANLEGDEMEEFIAKHLFERNYFYNHATHTINVDGKTSEEIVAAIRALI